MDRETRRWMGLILSSVGGVFVAGALAAPDTRLAAWQAYLIAGVGLAMIGAAFAIAFSESIPLILRSKRWAERENRRIIEDPNDERHRAYMAGIGRFPEVPEFKHREAAQYIDQLQRIHFERFWQRLWFFLLVGVLGGGLVGYLLARL